MVLALGLIEFELLLTAKRDRVCDVHETQESAWFLRKKTPDFFWADLADDGASAKLCLIKKETQEPHVFEWAKHLCVAQVRRWTEGHREVLTLESGATMSLDSPNRERYPPLSQTSDMG